MNFPYFISRRVAAEGQASFSRLIIRIAMVAVALSMAVMVISTALIAGFKEEISTKIFGFWGHMHITDANVDRSLLDTRPVRKDQPFLVLLDSLGPVPYIAERRFLGQVFETRAFTNGAVRHVQTFALKPGIIKARDEMEGIILKGIGAGFDWAYMDRYLESGQRLTLSDSTISSGIILSRQTADRLKVDVGDRFTMHFVQGGDQLRRRFAVEGIYKTGLEEYDQKFALVDIRQVQRLLGWSEKEVSGFEVFFDDIDDLNPLTEYIYFEILPNDLYAETIREKLPEIFDWLDLQDINEVVILALMVIVAIINMITGLMILILERTNMIGTLKALGATNWSIRKIFLYYAAIIIVVGQFWGNLIGVGLCLLQDRFEFIRLDEANYYLSVAPIKLRFWTIALLNAGTLLITVIFLILPSYLVTRISPVRAIRFK